MKYEENRKWSDQYLRFVNPIVGALQIAVASDFRDRYYNEDLAIIPTGRGSLACRFRRPGFRIQYPHEFTIRSALASDGKTELAKIEEGLGDWMFYGHTTNNFADGFETWWVLDLEAFRQHWKCARERIKYTVQSNRGRRDSKFHAFDIRSFLGPPQLVIDSNEAHKHDGCPEREVINPHPIKAKTLTYVRKLAGMGVYRVL